MRLSVIVCTWNRREQLKAALASIAASQLPPSVDWEVLIVDNNSTDGTPATCEEFLRSHPGRFRYIQEPRPGKSFALNTGIENSQGEILAFTDDDVEVSPQWLAEILRTIDAWNCAGVAGRIIATWSHPKPRWFSDSGPYSLMAVIVSYEFGDTAHETTVPPFGANLAFKREVFARYGLYRTDIGPITEKKVGGEDTEFCRRVFSGGDKLVYAPQAIVYHPVDEARLTKKYFQAWYHAFGQAITRAAGVQPEMPTFANAPRYLYRKLAASTIQWLVSTDPKRRFYHKLQVRQLAGEIKESRQLRKQM